MFIGSPKGNHDRLLDFSTPKTGTLFFVPTFDMLDNFSSNCIIIFNAKTL
jgi:porphyrinogen peroxidase